MDKVRDNVNVEMECVAPEEHEAAAERNNGTMQEWFRTATHHTLFKCIPTVMIDALMELTKRRLNVFPAKHGISTEFSPSAIMGEPKLDYNKHLKCVLGNMSRHILTGHNRMTPLNVHWMRFTSVRA